MADERNGEPPFDTSVERGVRNGRGMGKSAAGGNLAYHRVGLAGLNVLIFKKPQVARRRRSERIGPSAMMAAASADKVGGVPLMKNDLASSLRKWELGARHIFRTSRRNESLEAMMCGKSLGLASS